MRKVGTDELCSTDELLAVRSVFTYIEILRVAFYN